VKRYAPRMMTTDVNDLNPLNAQRRFFAEEVQAVGNVRTSALVGALARVPRERFLPPGPWLIRGESDFGGPARLTADADPRRILHNIVVAIDPARQLFNGQPSTLALWIDALGLRAGHHVLHVGCGLGYYSALIAECVGETGRVVAVDIDDTLAAGARTNLAIYPWAEARSATGVELGDETFDAILVNAGMTHPHDAWLHALRPGGRLVLPLTCAFPQAGPTLGKGIVVLITRSDQQQDDFADFAARLISFVAIYSAQSIRDSAMEALLAQAMRQMPFPNINRLRLDPHEPSASCWLHSDRFCLTLQTIA
jgi:protein-L-isoaspartate(D-aspartate) O-methyltransferase